MDARDSMLIFWPEEINKHFALEPQNYTTPAFDGKHAANEFTSQEELMAFLQEDGRRFRHHASLLCRYDPELQV